MRKWFQYSIDKEWSIERIDSLPPYSGRWHYLFEPQLLIRVEGDDKPVTPPDAVWGDPSKDRTGCLGGGTIWPGDVDFYGTEELHETVLDFLHANSRLIQVLRKEGKNRFRMRRKMVHLLSNQFGMNYLQEFFFSLRWAFRSFRLYLKYGSQ